MRDRQREKERKTLQVSSHFSPIALSLSVHFTLSLFHLIDFLEITVRLSLFNLSNRSAYRIQGDEYLQHLILFIILYRCFHRLYSSQSIPPNTRPYRNTITRSKNQFHNLRRRVFNLRIYFIQFFLFVRSLVRK